MQTKTTEKAFNDAVGKPRFNIGDEVICLTPRKFAIMFSKCKIYKIGEYGYDTVECENGNITSKAKENLMTKEEAKAKFNSWIDQEEK